MRVELVVAFNNVLVLPLTDNSVCTQIGEGSRVDRSPACQREQVAERSHTINRKVFDAEGVRDSESACGKESHADVSNGIRPLNLRWNVVLAENKNVGRCELPGNSTIEICAGHILKE